MDHFEFNTEQMSTILSFVRVIRGYREKELRTLVGIGKEMLADQIINMVDEFDLKDHMLGELGTMRVKAGL